MCDVNLKIHLEPGFDISVKKVFLQSHIPKKIIHKSALLLDTLLNDLMEQAMKYLEKADVELQNAFFEADFRKRVRDWVTTLDNPLQLDPVQVKYASDPRWKQGFIAGGTTFVIGTAVTVSVFIPTMAVGAIVAGLVTIILSAIAFKMAYDKAAPASRDVVKSDVEKYLVEAERQVQEWLLSVMDAFSKDFNAFCSAKGFSVEGRIE